MKRTFLLAGAVSVLFLAETYAETPSSSDRAIIAVVDGFHDALHRGDAASAMTLLASDAAILESGATETRDEYEKHHLPEDIAFSRAVKVTSSTPTVHIEGAVAWVSSTSRVTGTFDGREVDSAAAELIVLTNSNAGWRIRAIHWSSHALKKGIKRSRFRASTALIWTS